MNQEKKDMKIVSSAIISELARLRNLSKLKITTASIVEVGARQQRRD
jgi:hypothetical protein